MKVKSNHKFYLLVAITALALALISICICSCGPKEVDLSSKDSIEAAVGTAENVPIDFNKKYAAAAPTEKGASENMIVQVSGLKGGTAEVYTDEGTISASEFMIKYLNELTNNTMHYRIAGIKCGSDANTIPNSFTLTLNINKKHEENAKKIFSELVSKIKEEYKNETAFTSQISIEPASGEFPSQQDAEKIVNALNALPCGIVAMSKNYKGVVETFGNIGIIELNSGQFHCSAVLRSLDKNTLKNTSKELSEKLKESKIDWSAPENIG